MRSGKISPNPNVTSSKYLIEKDLEKIGFRKFVLKQHILSKYLIFLQNFLKFKTFFIFYNRSDSKVSKRFPLLKIVDFKNAEVCSLKILD